jgi:hypothetical protein
MGRFIRMGLGWLVGGMVWALVAALMTQLAEHRADLAIGILPSLLINGAVAAPAGVPGALIFLLLGLLLVGQRGSSAMAGLLGGLLFLIATAIVWGLGLQAKIPAPIFGLFPVTPLWDEIKTLWIVRENGFQLMGAQTLMIPITLAAGLIGGAIYGVISGADRAARRRANYRPAVNFGE